MSEIDTETVAKSEESVTDRDKDEKNQSIVSDCDKKKTKSNHKKHHSKRQQHKRWKKGGKFKRRKNHKENKGDQNNSVNEGQSCNPNRKHTKNNVAVQRNKRLQQAFATVSKFFLPDKLPRKARLIPPTKFLLGGNISDPLNLNSLQNESENAVTPKSSPVQTTSSRQPVEVLIPPNIHDPLHLLDPVDSVEYEMQLCSPMKRGGKYNKNRHRKRRKSCRESASETSLVANVSAQSDTENISADNSGVIPSSMIDGDVPSTSNVSEPERVVKNLRLELSQAGTGRKRNCSESSNSGKCKQRRVDMDKIVSPVIPQTYPNWKRPHKNPSKPGRNRTKSYSRSTSDDSSRPTSSNENPKEELHADDLENKQSMQEGNPNESNPALKHNRNSKYQYGNYDRYYGYRHLNEFMDVRLKVFKKNPLLFKEKDILDIGCNVGLLTIWIGKSLQPKSIVGLDIDKKLINRAHKNLSVYVRVPEEQNNSNASLNQMGTEPVPGTSKENPKRRRYSRRYSRRCSRFDKQTNTYGDVKFFPVSFPLCLGRIPALDNLPTDGDNAAHPLEFPENVSFKVFNYVPKDENQLVNETQQYDLILCLSVTKWIHLNFGDAGLKMAFKRMFNQLRPGGKLILEAQNWASYKKKKNFTDTIKNNYKTIRFFPKKFNEYLLSSEVGFSHSYPLGIPRHLSKGFSRPIQLYVKGDFTPSHAQWSDYHISQTPYQTPKSDKQKNKYYTNLLIGNSTPYASHGNYSYRVTDPSPYYNPFATDSYLPSYDNETTRRTYCFASPLYSTTWSPPTTDSRAGSQTNTPAGGSVRNAEMDEGYNNSRPHVYPPCSDDFEDGKSSTRSLEHEDNSPNAQHVYSESVLSDEKDDSRSPKTNMEYQEPIHIAEQINVVAIAEQNGVVVNHVNHVNHVDHQADYEEQNHREDDVDS